MWPALPPHLPDFYFSSQFTNYAGFWAQTAIILPSGAKISLTLLVFGHRPPLSCLLEPKSRSFCRFLGTDRHYHAFRSQNLAHFADFWAQTDIYCLLEPKSFPLQYFWLQTTENQSFGAKRYRCILSLHILFFSVYPLHSFHCLSGVLRSSERSQAEEAFPVLAEAAARSANHIGLLQQIIKEFP